ncbi:MAG: polyprenyl synthetase family protein [Anaerolineae bacterium]|nr:polyprenyl synthetase family protein [Anaerolineae bacterium]MDK1081747.1 polyprenyl synthetase family protein [Anaerolineae bacterium]MDK1118434.1 polyprenyl synthetase family protein [Anaerolineae bacterium]
MSIVSFDNPIQEKISLVEDQILAQAQDNHPDLYAALEQLLAAGGKRVRPSVVLLIGDMLGGPEDKLVSLGAAVEMLHTATLVHDDLIDISHLRRGNPTLNALWSPAATVLTGDFLFARAAGLAAEADHMPVMILFADTLAVMVNGELDQLFASQVLISRENYYQRIYAKTASLFEMSAQSAAMISATDDETVEAFRIFGYEMGMAFQIMDDILDFTGEQSSVGKPIGSDLLHGIVTLPCIYYAETHPEDVNLKLLIEASWTDQDQMQRLIELIRESDAIQKSKREAEDFINRALEQLAPYHSSIEKNALEDLARYVVDREI